MNWNYFSLVGYLSVLLWVCVPVLWLMHFRGRRSRWICHLAMVLALLSFAFAKINSETYVNRIELDPGAQTSGRPSPEEAKRKAVEDGRGEEVAQIRFAEDASGDFLDKAGMNESDRKYLESLNQSAEPEWKKSKKNRNTEGPEEKDLDSVLGGKKAISGMKTDALQEEDKRPPVLMTEPQMAMANRLDGLNLDLIRILILIAVIMLAMDYLGRANRYAEASLPLPLPSGLLNSLTAIPPVVVRPVPARRSMSAELAWLARRGDCFVYLTDDPKAAAEIPPSLPRLCGRWWPMDVLRVSGDEVGDDFIFESLWYGRSCFAVDSADRAVRMLSRFVEMLEKRKKFRARTAQTVHVVWDVKDPMPEAMAHTFAKLAQTAGFSLFACHGNPPSSESDKRGAQ